LHLPLPVHNANRVWHDLIRLSIFLLALWSGYLLAAALSAQGFANWAGPLALAVACLWTAFRVVADDAIHIWTPLPWFLTASAVFFGIGPLVYTFGSERALAELDELWTVGSEELWRTNLLNTIATLLIVAVYLAAGRLVRVPLAPLSPHEEPASTVEQAKSATLLFLSVGGPFRYFVTLPHEFGLLGFVPPGMLAGLDQFATLSLLMLSYLATRLGKGWTAAFLALFTLETTVALLRFHKSALILVFVMAILGRHMARRNLLELVASAVVVIVLYVASSPLVNAGRLEIIHRSGNHFEASLSERLDIVGQFLTTRGAEEPGEDEAEQSVWQRLCYAGPQAFAMRRYDEGLPGDSFALALYVLVPRFLAPDKPIMTDVGFDFTELAHGYRSSTTGIGIYGEAYWNGGWPMVALVCLVVGLMYALFARLVVYAVSRPNWLLLPSIFFGLKLGFRIDGWFVADYLGAALLGLVYAAIVFLLTRRTSHASPVAIRHAQPGREHVVAHTGTAGATVLPAPTVSEVG
jgi:hypothetical protein